MLLRDSPRKAALALAALLACGLPGCRPAASEEENDAPPSAVPVQAVKAELTTLEPSVDLVGTLVVIPEHTTVVSSKVSGWIQKVSVVEGATVHAGDEVVLLDTRFAQVDVAKAAASVAENEATLARLKRGYLPQEIEMAREEFRRSQQQAGSLRAELAALEPLWKREEIPHLQYAKAESSLRAAEAAQAAAEARLKLVEAGTPREEIAEAEAQLATARAGLDGATLTLELSTITSAIAGTVMQLTARQGMFVERATPLLTIADLSKVFLEVRIPSAHMADVGVGARVDVFAAPYPDQQFQGRIARISGQADATTGDVVVFVEIANEKTLLRPGMACRARLWLPQLPRVLAVPVAAVADRSGTPVVTVARQGKAHEIEVALGARTHQQVQITQGLSAGDWVVTEGGYGLPDGCPVEIVEKPPAATPFDGGP